jgi:hypothetical protein
VTRGAIDSYLESLDDELRLARAPRRRLLAEVKDHLRASADELAAEVEADEAERRAVERFGAAATVARGFAVAVAATSARRSTYGLALAFAAYASACLAFALTASSQFADFPQGAPSALALQVAVVALAVSLVRALRWRGSARPPEDRIRFLANGAIIGVAALAAGLAGEAVVALTRPAGVLPWQDAPFVIVPFAVAVVATLAAGVGAAGAAFRTSTLDAVPGRPTHVRSALPTLADDVAGLVPRALGPVTAAFGRPALLVSAVAGLALGAVFVSQVSGRPFEHHASVALPALALATLEALCILAGYVALGRSLGLRGERSTA